MSNLAAKLFQFAAIGAIVPAFMLLMFAIFLAPAAGMGIAGYNLAVYLSNEHSDYITLRSATILISSVFPSLAESSIIILSLFPILSDLNPFAFLIAASLAISLPFVIATRWLE